MSTSASRPVFAILSALVEERAGLHYGPAEQDLFLDRVKARCDDAGFESLLDYYYFLRYDPGGPRELDELVAHLVVNETYFFREIEALRVIVTRFLRPLVQSGHRPRVWSAACATGEEPLTLAMLLAQAGLLSQVELVASDISQRALDSARSGSFSRRSLRHGVDAELAQRWIREQDGRLRVAPELLEAIEWRRVNLCEPAETSQIGACDVVLCRNVLIYFRDDTVVGVLERLAARLKPDGALFVGVSESLLRFGTALTCEEADQVFFYRNVS
ncbi:MAG TPA: protein-glutamate O-methyltransferase CheR [Polyangiaceae bacterium]|nr:protein-glutamate O-methyltransferase CheR [Polyangiaceae bacterium]